MAPVTVTPSARALAGAEIAVEQLETQLKALVSVRDRLRDRQYATLPLSDDEGEAAREIREGLVDGVSLRAVPVRGGRYLDLRGYEDAGYRLTKRMLEHVKRKRGHKRWTVEPQTHTAIAAAQQLADQLLAGAELGDLESAADAVAAAAATA